MAVEASSRSVILHSFSSNPAIYLAKGLMHGYDGNKKYALKSDEYCLLRKNRLARYNKQKVNDEYEKVAIMFDETFLRKFQERNNAKVIKFQSRKTFIVTVKTTSLGGGYV